MVKLFLCQNIYLAEWEEMRLQATQVRVSYTKLILVQRRNILGNNKYWNYPNDLSCGKF